MPRHLPRIIIVFLGFVQIGRMLNILKTGLASDLNPVWQRAAY